MNILDRANEQHLNVVVQIIEPYRPQFVALVAKAGIFPRTNTCNPRSTAPPLLPRWRVPARILLQPLLVLSAVSFVAPIGSVEQYFQ